jgi:hypothetical protein
MHLGIDLNKCGAHPGPPPQKKIAIDRCHHSSSTFTKYSAANGVETYGWQCNSCGTKTTRFYSADRAAVEFEISKSEISSAAAFRKELSENFYHEQYTAQDRQSSDHFFLWYDKYLLSGDWSHKRELVLQRAKGICEGCGCSTATQVHHLTYNNVGYEFLFELVAICGSCHARLHKK